MSQRLPHTVRQGLGFHRTFRYEGNEFLATKPTNFAVGKVFAKDLCEGFQHAISRVMPVRIIDALKQSISKNRQLKGRAPARPANA